MRYFFHPSVVVRLFHYEQGFSVPAWMVVEYQNWGGFGVPGDCCDQETFSCRLTTTY